MCVYIYHYLISLTWAVLQIYMFASDCLVYRFMAFSRIEKALAIKFSISFHFPCLRPFFGLILRMLSLLLVPQITKFAVHSAQCLLIFILKNLYCSAFHFTNCFIFSYLGHILICYLIFQSFKKYLCDTEYDWVLY